MQILEKMQKTHAADGSTGAKGFEATSIRGCCSSNAAAANSCKVGYSSVWKNENDSERAKSLEQGIALRIETNPTALKGRNQDVALSGLNGKLVTTDRAMPYPIDCAASRQKTMGKVLGYGMMLLAFWIGSNSKAMGQTVIDQGSCGASGNNLTWVLEEVGNDTVLTISGSGDMNNWYWNNPNIIPWYSYKNTINNVLIGDSVTSIGNCAFYNCSGLTSVTIPSSVTSIGSSVFSGCFNLISVTIPSSVTTIGDNAFYNCSSLISVTIPNSVTSIGDYALYGCSSLSSATIGNSVTRIGTCAFYRCSSLTFITIPDSVTYIGVVAFYNCSSLQTVNFNAVNCTTMGSGNNPVFSGCTAFTTLNIGDSVKIIPQYAFCDCSGLTSVTIPNSVTSIGYDAFYGCSSLSSVAIGNSVTSIGDRAFYGCSSLPSVTIPNSVTSIGESAFSRCSSLDSINVDNNNPRYCSIGGIVYSKMQDTLVVYPGGRTGTAVIPNIVTTIGSSAFSYCSSLSSVTIGNNVKTIGNYAFYICRGLIFITCKAITPPTLGSNVFQYVPDTIPIYVPCGSIPAYQDSVRWNYFSNFMEFEDTTFYSESICEGYIYNDDNFSDLTVAGVYYLTLQGVNGCDSVIALTLTVTNCGGNSFISGYVGYGNGQKSLSQKSVENPAEDVNVYLQKDQNSNWKTVAKTVTDSEGYFEFRNVPAGRYRVILDIDDLEHVDEPQIIEVNEGDSITNIEYEITEEGIVNKTGGVGIVETHCNASLRVYPNPAKNQLTIDCRDVINHVSTVEIYDVVGQTVGAGFKPAPTNAKNEITIDISHLAAGMYFLKIGNRTARFVKE